VADLTHLAASFRHKTVNADKTVRKAVSAKMLARNLRLRTALFDAFLLENPFAILRQISRPVSMNLQFEI